MSRPEPEGRFSGAGGTHLWYRSWPAPARRRAVLLLVHGFGEHSGRYGHLARALTSRGFQLFAFDLRGHGRSAGPRGHVTAWSEYLGDLDAFLRLVRAEQGRQPLFLYGHSMGAIVALDYARRRPEALRGVVASGTPLRPGDPARPGRIRLARWLSVVWPRFPLSVGIDPEALSGRPEVVRAYREDELVFGKATARWGTELLDAIDRIERHAGELEVPLLLVHGGADRIALASGAREFFRRVRHADKAILVYEGARHEPHNDVVGERLVEDLEGWLRAHLM